MFNIPNIENNHLDTELPLVLTSSLWQLTKSFDIGAKTEYNIFSSENTVSRVAS